MAVYDKKPSSKYKVSLTESEEESEEERMMESICLVSGSMSIKEVKLCQIQQQRSTQWACAMTLTFVISMPMALLSWDISSGFKASTHDEWRLWPLETFPTIVPEIFWHIRGHPFSG